MNYDNSDFINNVIGKLIREHREKAGCSQNELAEKFGLFQQHISQVELGKRNIGSDQLVKLSLFLGFSLDGILERLNMPPTTVTLAKSDDFTYIQKFDSHISENRLAACINNDQV